MIRAKIPLPPSQREGKFEVRFAQQLIEIMTVRPTTGKASLIRCLRPFTSLSPWCYPQSEQFYYHVTPSGCTCKAWQYRQGSRHHTAAFPEAARAMAERIEKENEAIKAKPKDKAKARAGPMEVSRSIDPGESLFAGKLAGFRPVLM